jgi:hypothetical protein
VGLRPPRISEEARERLRTHVVAADSSEAADRVIAQVWSILDGDMQDRITALIHAAQGAVDSKGRTLGGVERALADLNGREVAATTTKRLKEGPYAGH